MGVVAMLPVYFIWSACAFAPSQRTPAAVSGARPSLRSAANLRLIWSYGSFGFGYIIPATFLPAMARQVIPDPAVFGWAWPIFGTAALLSVLLAGYLSSRYSYRAIWLASQLVMAIGVAVPVAWNTIGGIVVSALCVGGTFVVATMAGVQEGRRVAAGNATSLIAAMTTAFAVGQILGPLVVSAVAEKTWGMSFSLLTATLVLLAGAASLLRNREKRREEKRVKEPRLAGRARDSCESTLFSLPSFSRLSFSLLFSALSEAVCRAGRRYARHRAAFPCRRRRCAGSPCALHQALPPAGRS